MRISRVTGRQARRPFLINLKVRRMLKRTSGLYELIRIVQRMNTKLESKFLDSLQIKAKMSSQITVIGELSSQIHKPQRFLRGIKV